MWGWKSARKFGRVAVRCLGSGGLSGSRVAPWSDHRHGFRFLGDLVAGLINGGWVFGDGRRSGQAERARRHFRNTFMRRGRLGLSLFLRGTRGRLN